MRGAAATAAAIIASVALVAQGGVATDASWNDREFAHGAVGTVDCAAAEGQFASRGGGQMLSGSLLGIDLDRIAAVEGIVVTNDGARSRPDPSNAVPADPAPDAYADPLTAEALGAVSVALPGVLQFPMHTDLGLVSQYARASSGGTAVGAGGALSSSGGIALDSNSEYPELATLRVSELLREINPSAAATLTNVADVSLVAGAVTGRAEVDGCGLAWSGASSEVVRDYLAASLRTDITSPTVGALVRGTSGAIDALQLAVDGLGSNSGVRGGITSGLSALANGVLAGSGLRLGSVTLGSLTASTDLAPVRSLLSQPFGDAGRIITVDPVAGTISVDTAALLEAAYPGQYSDGLNGLPPNSDLLGDPALVTALTGALRTALAGWVAGVEAALVTAIDSVEVSASARIVVQISTGGLLPVWVDIAGIDVDVAGSLAELRSGAVQATAGLQLLGILSGVLNAVLGTLVDALVADFGTVVATAVDGALAPLGALPSAVETLADPIVAAASTVSSTLFQSGVVAVTVNAQNAPEGGSAEPRDWAALPDGRYDVAALRIGVLGALAADDARLYLGRGSVGPGCVLAQAPLPCAGY